MNSQIQTRINMFDYNYFSSLESSWDKLKKSKLPVFIYGMGDGCLKILSQFEKHGIICSGIFASDDFVRGQEFEGYKIKKYDEIKEQYNNFIAVPAFGTNLPDVMKRIDKIAQEQTLIMPDTPVFGHECFYKEDFLKKFSQAKKVFDLLTDEKSKEVFINILSYKITGDIIYLKNSFTDPEEAYKNILRLGNSETYLDLGAYTGDTIEEFVYHTDCRYNKIIAVEPNTKNFRKCVKNTLHYDNIEWYNAAVWNCDEIRMFSKNAGRQAQISNSGIPVQCRSVDSILGKSGCTYIKYDVEGADKQAILGSAKTLQRFSPKICTALYHRAYDIIDLPLLIHDINPDYKMYMRQYTYYPAWETNLFCVKL